jgi:manganese/zinc/iron transport system substrate-binding protein
MKRSIRFFIFSLIPILSILIATSCGQHIRKTKSNNFKKVTTTTAMIADLVENIGGKYVKVTGLMGPGVDPHLYKASQGDIAKLNDADIIFYNGLHLEGKMTDIFTKMARKKPITAISGNIDKTLLLTTKDNNHYDPHIWFDVKLWMKAAARVKETLIEQDPSHKKEYEQQTMVYLDKLKELDSYVQKRVASLPKKKRVLVTAHDAFGYFGRAYKMEVIGLQGISTASEYGLKDVQRIINLLTNQEIKAIFVESSVPKRSIEAVIQGAKKKNYIVSIGGQLYSDAMDSKGTNEGTYIGMVHHNVNTIVDSLK